MKLSNVFANFIRFLHILLMVFLLLTPFSNNIYLLKISLLLIPFLMLHWITNNDTCALTEIEKYLRGTSYSYDTFIGSLVGPVFMLDNIDQISRYIIYLVSTILWLISAHNYKNLLKRK